jgi:hypothetical protein
MTSVPWSTASSNPGSKHNPTAIGIGLERESLKIRLGIVNDRYKPKSIPRGALRMFMGDPQPHQPQPLLPPRQPEEPATGVTATTCALFT